MIYVLDEADGVSHVVKQENQYGFYIGVQDFMGYVESGCIKCGDYGLINVYLDDAIGLEQGMLFAIRQNGNTIGLGKVITA